MYYSKTSGDGGHYYGYDDPDDDKSNFFDHWKEEKEKAENERAELLHSNVLGSSIN